MSEKWISRREIEAYPELSAEEARQVLAACTERVVKNLDYYGDGFPGAASEHNFYTPGPNLGWTTGFYTGEIWLAYLCEKDTEKKKRLREAGEAQVQSFLQRIENKTDVDHHDMGFLYSPSCVMAYKLTGNEEARRAALLAADQLMRRFRENGEFLQAWGQLGVPDNYRFIIDCLLNVPLLFFAARETGDETYRDIALRHLRTAKRYCVRGDGSTWHTVFMDPETGAFARGATCQGYRDGSAWSRGQAWGVYGFALALYMTGDEEFEEKFNEVTDFFLNHLPKDLIPYWDFTFGDGDDEPRDSSSLIVAALGLLLMDHMGKGSYRATASRLLKAATTACFEPDASRTNGLLLHGTYSHKSPYNTCDPCGTDECVIWGDYFYMEALMTLLDDEFVSCWRRF